LLFIKSDLPAGKIAAAKKMWARLSYLHRIPAEGEGVYINFCIQDRAE